MRNTYRIFSLKKIVSPDSFSLDEVRDGLELDFIELALNLGLVFVQEEVLAINLMDVLEEDGHGPNLHQPLALIEDGLARVVSHLYE